MRVSLLILAVVVFVGCSSDQKNPPNSSNVSSNQAQARPPVPKSPHTAAADQKIVDEVKRIVGGVLRIDAKTIDVNFALSKQKIPADELDVVEIIMEVEEFFKIEIKDDELGGSDISKVTSITVNEIAELVGRKQKTKNPAPK